MVSEPASWTLEELVRRAALALQQAAQDGGYSGAPNKRVRDLPDQRAIRWYISTGLLDRPHGGRGRGARYGERHLHQLVAIKRLQAAGLALAEVQARLVGADEVTLRAASGVSPMLVASPRTPLGPARVRFWTAAGGGEQPSERSPSAASEPESAAPGPSQSRAIGAVTGLVLPGGVTVILGASAVRVHDLDDAARQDLAHAAEPLLRELVRHGLIDPAPRNPDPAPDRGEQS